MTTPAQLRAELATGDRARTIDHLRDWLQRAETGRADQFPRLLGEGQSLVGDLLRLLDREDQ